MKEIIEKMKSELSKDSKIVAAYLFGSFAEGTSRPDSDIDIALFFDETVDKFQQLERQIDLTNRLRCTIKRKIQIVVLNRAPASLAFRAIRGILLYDKHPTQRALFEAKIASNYYNHKFYQKIYNKTLYERAREYESSG
jgi:predicted nucleotidyltransferase